LNQFAGTADWMTAASFACGAGAVFQVSGPSEQGGIRKAIDYLSRLDFRDAFTELDHAIRVDQ
jgi:hypothetical protein